MRAALAGATLAAALLLGGCGGSDGGTSASSGTRITGTAASGAALTSGTVELNCNNGYQKSGIAISASGTWSAVVPPAVLPCAVKASDGTNTYYSFTSGTSSPVTANVTPLTTLLVARLLGEVPDDTVFAGLDATDLDKFNATDIATAVAELVAALSGYALPADFDPVTSPLTAAAGSQSGNDHDRLLDQFKAARGATTLESLLATAAGGTLPTLPAPPLTPGVATLEDFFSTFAGSYTLTVTSSGAEGSNNAAAVALFPEGSERTVTLKANGDVSIQASGRTITYLAASYSGHQEFSGGTASLNTVIYRASNGIWIDLYITYDPATGQLRVDPQGFVNSEGFASLRGTVYVPPVASSCEAGSDTLVFTGAPADFCGFTRAASANSIAHYFQFTSTGSHGTNYVKFETNGDDTAVTKVTIENDAYAFGCGGMLAACSGVAITADGAGKLFTLDNTALDVIFGADVGINVTGSLLHPAPN